MPSVEHNADIPDWLHPMLVKELRQALRSRAFVGAMLWVQASMSIIVILQTLISISARNAAGFKMLNIIFWFNAVLILHLLLPFRCLLFQDEDAKSENLELLQMTDVFSGRLVLCKWAACLVLALLIVTTLLPYTLIRYFLGGVDIADEISNIFWLWLSSGLLATFGILFSTLGTVGRAVSTLFLMAGLPFYEGACWFLMLSWRTVSSSELVNVFMGFGAAFMVSIICMNIAAANYSDRPRHGSSEL